jgi:hypothetical protein
MKAYSRLAALAALVGAVVAPVAYPGPLGLFSRNGCKPCPRRCIPCCPAVPGPCIPADENTRAHFLLVGDTVDRNIGPSDKADLVSMKALIEAGIPASRRSEVRVLEGPGLTPEKVLAAVDALPIGPSDAVLFYFTGHGAYDPRWVAADDPTRGHFIVFPENDGGQRPPPLLRRTVLDRLKPKNARLTVLLSDACGPKSEVTPFKVPPAVAKPETRGDRGVLYSLLLKQGGVVDINAAPLGQVTFVDLENPGSLFTKAVVQVVREGQFPDPANVSWQQAFDALSKATNAVYQDFRTRRLADPRTGASSRWWLEQFPEQFPQAFQLTARPIAAARP